jgi:hypothetical protein
LCAGPSGVQEGEANHYHKQAGSFHSAILHGVTAIGDGDTSPPSEGTRVRRSQDPVSSEVAATLPFLNRPTEMSSRHHEDIGQRTSEQSFFVAALDDEGVIHNCLMLVCQI